MPSVNNAIGDINANSNTVAIMSAGSDDANTIKSVCLSKTTLYAYFPPHTFISLIFLHDHRTIFAKTLKTEKKNRIFVEK